MRSVELAQVLSLALVGLALVPTGWVFGREALRRRATRRAVERVAAARRLLPSGSEVADVDALAVRLKQEVDPVTCERVTLELLRAPDAVDRTLGQRIFALQGLGPRFAKELREARRWSERTHAAEILGAAGEVSAVPALVAALRDPHEDEDSVKAAAAAALAKLRDPGAVPLLVAELVHADGRAAPKVAEVLVTFGELATEPLLEVMSGNAPSAARTWAARALGRIKDSRATDALVARLQDRDDLLRMAAAEALGNIGDARSLQPLVRSTLRDPAPQVRAHAAGAVARIEGERAVDVLVAALSDPDYATRLRALEAFETMKALDTAPLETALRDANVEVRRRAALALERVGYLDRLIQELSSQSPSVQKRAYEAFVELGRAGLVDSIASFVHHASFEVRALAARATGELGATRVAPLLVTAMDDAAWPVRAAIAEALGRLRHDASVVTLVKRLTDPEEPVREAAAEALTSFAPSAIAAHASAIADAYDTGTIAVRLHVVILAARVPDEAMDPLLVRASQDPSDAVRMRAVTALGDRRGQVVVEPLVARLTDPSLEVRMAAVTALGAAVNAEAFEGLMKALTGAAYAVRERIAETLARGARELLFARLDELEASTSHDVRLGVAWTLGKTSDPRAVPALTRFLRDPNPALRASAAGALAKIETVEAVGALLAAGDDPDGRVRAAAVNGLGRAGPNDRRVVPALMRRLVDPDAFVRNRAIVSLARAGRREVEEAVVGAANVEEAARVVALALVGSDATLGAALDGITKPQALERVTQFLAKEDQAVRAAFFDAVGLGDPGGPGASDLDQRGLVERYEALLRSSLEVESRRLAVRALARLTIDRASEVLADAMVSDPDELVRGLAAEALESRADNAHVRRSMMRAVADPNLRVVEASIRGLATRKDREVQQALLSRLGAGEASTRQLLEATLAARFGPDPMSFVDWMMGVEEPEQLIPGIRVLARMASPETLPLLAQLVRSRSALVRREATLALGVIPGRETAAILSGLSSDPDEGVRLALLEVLASRMDVGLSRNLLHDPSVRVRVAAARALGAARGAAAEEAEPLLALLVDDGAAEVRGAVLLSLALLDGAVGLERFAALFPKSALETRLALKADPRARDATATLGERLQGSVRVDDRRALVMALGAIAHADRARVLLPALRDPSPDVRVAAIRALSSMDDETVRERLAELLVDPEPAVREAARRTTLRTVG